MFDRLMMLPLALVALALLPAGGAAQDWRDVTSFRQRSDESRLDVHVRYGAGELVVRPGTAGELYRVGMRYDARAFEPVTDYRNGRLDVGVETAGRGVNLRSTESGRMRLSLSPDVPLDLDLDFGAVEAILELGGLRISRIDVETGASETELTFAEPNPLDCESLSITMGAASIEAEGLANANCGVIEVEGGVGEISLDFSGHWRRDLSAEITMALGSATLRVPSDVGVRVSKDTFLTDFNGSRFHKRDGVHYSENWDSARRRLTVDLTGAFGTIDVRWIAPATTAP